ncbi:hypothetical protein GF340_04035 [Candidatus Peregrinibacteria bacterium]|nr:hypothetical protein [Candidatus Peregrinibacteria bacterium]
MAPASQTISRDDLIRQIKICILIPYNERQEWTKRAKNMPEILIEEIYTKFKEKNDQVKKYIAKAIENDPTGEKVKLIKEKLSKIKQKLQTVEEKEEQESAEDILKQL